MKKLLAVFLISLMMLPGFCDWYDPDWIYRKTITIQSSEVDADLTDFPVYVNLANLGSDFFTNVDSTGEDIRITKADGTTEVPRQVVTIDTGGNTGEVHFKATGTLSSSSNTVFYIYYGNAAATEPAASATYGSQNVWDSNYKGVYHLNEDPTTATAIKDSTSNNHTSTATNGLGSSNLVECKVGKCIELNGSDEYINFGAVSDFDFSTNQTISCWGYRNSSQPSSDSALWSKITPGSYGGQMSYLTGSNLFIYQNSSGRVAVTRPSNDTWFKADMTSTGSTGEIFINGASGSTGTTVNPSSSGDDFIIGGYFSPLNRLLAGKIDEFRLSDIVRSDYWISTEYNNQSAPASFYTIGTQEEGSPIIPSNDFYSIFSGASF